MYDRFYVSFIFEDRYLYILKGLKTTVILTLGSFILGTLLALVFCALKRSKVKTVARIANIICNFFVQIPTMVLLMVFVYIVFGSSTLNILITVTIALTVKAAAFLAGIFHTAVEAVSVEVWRPEML